MRQILCHRQKQASKRRAITGKNIKKKSIKKEMREVLLHTCIGRCTADQARKRLCESWASMARGVSLTKFLRRIRWPCRIDESILANIVMEKIHTTSTKSPIKGDSCHGYIFLQCHTISIIIIIFFFREGGIEFNTANIRQPFAVYFLIHLLPQGKIVTIQSWLLR